MLVGRREAKGIEGKGNASAKNSNEMKSLIMKIAKYTEKTINNNKKLQ